MNNINKILLVLIWVLKLDFRVKEEDVFEVEDGKFRKVFFLNVDWLVFNLGIFISYFDYRLEILSY